MYKKEVRVEPSVEVEILGRKIRVRGPKGELEREFKFPSEIKVEKAEGKILISSESERRRIKAMIGTLAAHIRNMILGVTKGFTFKLKIVYSHFPISVRVEGGEVKIMNFLGERTPRIAKIVGDCRVKVEGNEIKVFSLNVEDAGQTANNIERATRITGKDRRVFSDGIFIVGREEGEAL